VTLNEAERLKLAEIERQLEQDPAIARAFGGRRRMPRTSVRPVVWAVLAYLASLLTVFLVAGSGIAALLALPAAAVTLALLRWPGLLGLPVARRPHR
jgi:hypothetical protein